jgi:hypothetical protein
MPLPVVAVADICISDEISVLEPSRFVRLKVFYIVRFHILLLILIYILWTGMPPAIHDPSCLPYSQDYIISAEAVL